MLIYRVRDRIAQLMQGRYGAYGTDRFTRFLLVLWIFSFVLNAFIPGRVSGIIPLVIFVYTYFRLFSRNIPQRYRENEAYMRLEQKVISFFRRERNNLNPNSAFHIYTCPCCSQKIRIPRGKGRIMVRCPRCSEEFMKRS